MKGAGRRTSPRNIFIALFPESIGKEEDELERRTCWFRCTISSLTPNLIDNSVGISL